MPLVSGGIVLKLVVLWVGGKLFENQIKGFLDFIERYQWWVVIALFALTFVQSAGRHAQGRARGHRGDRATGRTHGRGALRCRDGRGP